MLLGQVAELEEALLEQLLPRDEADDRGVILEVRAGTGANPTDLCHGHTDCYNFLVCTLSQCNRPDTVPSFSRF